MAVAGSSRGPLERESREASRPGASFAGLGSSRNALCLASRIARGAAAVTSPLFGGREDGGWFPLRSGLKSHLSFRVSVAVVSSVPLALVAVSAAAGRGRVSRAAAGTCSRSDLVHSG